MSSVHTTFYINSREFTCVRMNAFAANKHLMRLQKIIVPVFGAACGGATSGLADLDIDLEKAVAVISEHLDEQLLESVVLPLFAEARVYHVESKVFIKGPSDIDRVFTSDNLFDLYELVFEVARHQFGPFFVSLASRFGGLAALKPAAS